MLRTSRRFAVLAALGIVAVPLTVVATAFACANLATMKLNRAAATPGTKVSFMGRNFNSRPDASPVEIRWNGRRGEVLATVRPSRNGKISDTIIVPKARPGYYMVVATQTAPNGKVAPGTPGRAVIRIRAARPNTSAVAPPVTTGGGPAGPALPIGLGLSALMLLGGLTTIAVRRRRLPATLSSATG